LIGGQIVADREAALHGRALADLLEPALEIFELLNVLALALPIDGPRIGDHVGYRVFVACEILSVDETIVEHPVEAVGFVGEAPHGVGLVTLRVAEAAEMTAFAELGALVGHLPHNPLGNLVLAALVLRPEAPAFSAMYIIMAPDSKMLIGAPPSFGSRSTMTGMR